MISSSRSRRIVSRVNANSDWNFPSLLWGSVLIWTCSGSLSFSPFSSHSHLHCPWLYLVLLHLPSLVFFCLIHILAYCQFTPHTDPISFDHFLLIRQSCNTHSFDCRSLLWWVQVRVSYYLMLEIDNCPSGSLARPCVYHLYIPSLWCMSSSVVSIITLCFLPLISRYLPHLPGYCSKSCELLAEQGMDRKSVRGCQIPHNPQNLVSKHSKVLHLTYTSRGAGITHQRSELVDNCY